jgi:hypothetical protein
MKSDGAVEIISDGKNNGAILLALLTFVSGNQVMARDYRFCLQGEEFGVGAAIANSSWAEGHPMASNDGPSQRKRRRLLSND